MERAAGIHAQHCATLFKKDFQLWCVHGLYDGTSLSHCPIIAYPKKFANTAVRKQRLERTSISPSWPKTEALAIMLINKGRHKGRVFLSKHLPATLIF